MNKLRKDDGNGGTEALFGDIFFQQLRSVTDLDIMSFITRTKMRELSLKERKNIAEVKKLAKCKSHNMNAKGDRMEC